MRSSALATALSLVSMGLQTKPYEPFMSQSEPARGQAQAGAVHQEDSATGSFRPGAGTVIVVELTKSLETKKAKVGDKVECDVVQDLLYKGKIIIPHDAQVLGHVTEATPSTKEKPQSRLGLVFEKIVLKDKRELPFQYPAVVMALASPVRRTTVPTTQMTDMPIQMEKGRTTGGAAIDALGANSNLAGANMRAPAEGAIGAANRGVIGIKGLALETPSPEMTVIVSSKGDVKLVFETQMVLRVIDPPKK